jgi:hypothetical protein
MKFKIRIINGILNYALALALVASPWIITIEEAVAGKLILVITGLILLTISLVSNFELGIIKSIRYKENLIANIIIGVFILLSPFLFGFFDISYKAHIFFGCVQIAMPLIAYRVHFKRRRSVLLYR